MIQTENQTEKSIHGIRVPEALAQAIQKALDNVRRVKIAHFAQQKWRVVERPITQYTAPMPGPVVYPVSPSRERE